MTTHPITLTTDQVRAALAGRLTQVRMPVEPQPADMEAMPIMLTDGVRFATESDWVRCPWGMVGDRLYVREQIYYSAEHNSFYYSCDGKGLGEENYLRLRELEFDQKESIDVESLPRWASRITLELTGVHVERLGNMSEADCRACGAEAIMVDSGGFTPWGYSIDVPDWHEPYAAMWDVQYGHRHPWSSSPWVWVLDVRRAETN